MAIGFFIGVAAAFTPATRVGVPRARTVPFVMTASAAGPLPANVLEIYEGRFRPIGSPPPDSARKGSTLGSSAADPQATVTADDVASLWSALLDACGSEEAALQAARQNPTVLSPLYSNPTKMAESKSALVRAEIDPPSHPTSD